MAEQKKSIHAGHRERIRNRLKNEGLSSFSEHEVLELLLTYAIPRIDVNPLAHELIVRFGRLSNVLEADPSELLQVKGMGENAALLLTMMPQLVRYYQMNALGERPVVINTADAKAYCGPLFVGAHEEHLYMICINQKGNVLHLSLLQTGTIDEVPIYPRTVVETALRHNAHSVILAHNHPSGIAQPSQADIEMTKSISAALETIGIKLSDHLIFAGSESYSMMSKRKMEQAEADGVVSYVTVRQSGRRVGLREEQDEWMTLLPEDL